MQEFGAELKARREAGGLSLDDLYERTRINPDFLRAIESGNFDVLPRVYVRLFLKQYAREVGLNQEETLKRYETLARPPEPEPAPRPEPTRSPSVVPLVAIAFVLLLAAAFGIRLFNQDGAPEETAPILTPAEMPSTAQHPPDRDRVAPQDASSAVAVGASGTASPEPRTVQKPQEAGAGETTPQQQTRPGTPSASPEPSQAEETAPAETLEPEPAAESRQTPSPAGNATATPAAPSDPEPEPVAENVSTTPAAQTNAPAAPANARETASPESETPSLPDRVVAAYSLTLSNPFGRQDSLLTLSARARQQARVSVLVDGRKVFEDVLSSGAERSWNARNRFRIEMDDAGALSLSMQGDPLQPIGQPGRKLRLFISRASIWVEELEPVAPGTEP